MNLWRISQTEHSDWDTYDSAVVVAATAEDARRMHPDGHTPVERWAVSKYLRSWCASPDDVRVEELGEAIEEAPRVVCASYNAGQRRVTSDSGARKDGSAVSWHGFWAAVAEWIERHLAHEGHRHHHRHHLKYITGTLRRMC